MQIRSDQEWSPTAFVLTGFGVLLLRVRVCYLQWVDWPIVIRNLVWIPCHLRLTWLNTQPFTCSEIYTEDVGTSESSLPLSCLTTAYLCWHYTAEQISAGTVLEFPIVDTQTQPCGRDIISDTTLRFSIFVDVTQSQWALCYRRFGTSYHSHVYLHRTKYPVMQRKFQKHGTSTAPQRKSKTSQGTIFVVLV
jgi:hypothetical protein